MYEYEIKLLGKKEDLAVAFQRFVEFAQSRSEARTYTFTTNYFDKDDQFYKAGYCLRYRGDQNGKAPVVELKELEAKVQTNLISARIEIGATGSDFLTSYFNLLARSDYPQDAPAPNPGTLQSMSDVVTTRTEQQFFLPEPGCDIETAMDMVVYMKDGHIYETESELEFEIKTKNPRMKAISTFFENHIFYDLDVAITYESKALRARKAIQNKPS